MNKYFNSNQYPIKCSDVYVEIISKVTIVKLSFVTTDIQVIKNRDEN